jgi:hypothetical protein
MDLDVLDCPRCGGRMKVLGPVEDPDVIPKMLRSMGLPAEAPSRSPSRPPPQQTFEFDQ